MATEIGALRVEMSANAAQFAEDLGKARQAARTETARMQQSFDKVAKSGGLLTKNIGLLKGALAGLSVGGLVLAVKHAAELADRFAKTADSIGIGVVALQEWEYAAELSGVQTTAFEGALQAFSKRVGEAKNNTGTLITLLRNYDEGLLSQIQNTKDVSSALDIYFEAMDKAADQSQKAALSAAAFGRTAGVQMTNMLRGGIEELRKMRKEASDLGLVFSEETARKAEEVIDAFTRMQRILSVNLQKLLLGLAPTFIAIGAAAAQAAPQIKAFVDSLLPLELKSADALQQRLDEIDRQLQEFYDKAKSPRDIGSLNSPAVQQIQSHASAQIRRLREERERLVPLLEEAQRTEKLVTAALETGTEGGGPDRAKVIESINEALQKENQSIQDQIGKLQVGEIEWTRITAIKRAFGEAQKAGIELTQQEIQAILDQAEAVAGSERALQRVEEAQKKANEAARETGETAADVGRDLGQTFTSALEDAIVEGKSFSDILKGLGQDLLRLFTRLVILNPILKVFTELFARIGQGGGNPAAGLLGNLFGGLFGGGGGGLSPVAITATRAPVFPGFATGGSFTVGGRGGTDANLVAFRATRGEQVTVTPPGGLLRGAGDGVQLSNNVQVNVYAPPGTPATTRESRTSNGGRRIDVILDEEMAKQVRGGTRFAKAMETQYGLRPTTVLR